MPDFRNVLCFGWSITKEDLFILAERMGLTPIEEKDTLSDYARDVATELGCEASVGGGSISPDICIFVAQELPCSFEALSPAALAVKELVDRISGLRVSVPVPEVWVRLQEIKESI